MAINGLNPGTNVNVASTNYEHAAAPAETAKTAPKDSDAVVYEKSTEAAKPSASERKVDTETIERLKAEADERNAQLKGLVEKMLLKQAGTSVNSEGLASVYRKLEVDEETRAQAQADIAEDGYWGVEQTSDRMVDFAKALAGDDPEMAEKMLDAIKEGYKQAEEIWGEELPQLCKDTLDATVSKMNEWIASLKEGRGTETAPTAPAKDAAQDIPTAQ